MSVKKPFTLATWNVNSLRVRLSQLLAWLETASPDVIALQETKIQDQDFPLQAIQAAGYHAVYAGQKAYNGVAMLSKWPLKEVVTDIPNLSDPQRRILLATVKDVRIMNLYVPNGESVDSEKYHYKLQWLQHVTAYLKTELVLHPELVVLGDFNIAPEDRDVHNPQQWEGHVLVSSKERLAFQGLLKIGIVDAFRLFEQAPGHFSWWDYRTAAFRRNHGLRIDHILISDSLVRRASQCYIDKAPRGWERPSDHAPVVVTLMGN